MVLFLWPFFGGNHSFLSLPKSFKPTENWKMAMWTPITKPHGDIVWCPLSQYFFIYNFLGNHSSRHFLELSLHKPLLLLHFVVTAAKTCPFYFFITCQNYLPLTAISPVSVFTNSCLDHSKDHLTGSFTISIFFWFYTIKCSHSLKQVLSYYSKPFTALFHALKCYNLQDGFDFYLQRLDCSRQTHLAT